MMRPVMSEAEHLAAQVRELREKVQAACFAVGAIRVLSSPELGSFDPADRLDDVGDQIESLAEVLGLLPSRRITCGSSPAPTARGGGRR